MKKIFSLLLLILVSIFCFASLSYGEREVMVRPAPAVKKIPAQTVPKPVVKTEAVPVKAAETIVRPAPVPKKIETKPVLPHPAPSAQPAKEKAVSVPPVPAAEKPVPVKKPEVQPVKTQKPVEALQSPKSETPEKPAVEHERSGSFFQGLIEKWFSKD